MPVETISADQTTQYTIAQSGFTWLLPWDIVITSATNGIAEIDGMTDNRILVEGAIVCSTATFAGVHSEAIDADVRVGETGLIRADTGIRVTRTGGEATVVNAGVIETTSHGIVVDASEVTIRNTGIIDSEGVALFSDATGLFQNIDIFNSGTIRATSIVSVAVAFTTIELSKTSRVIAEGDAFVATDPAGRIILDNAGVIRSGGTAVIAGDSFDQVVNRGLIVGDIHLGDGMDEFVSRRGQVRGDVHGGSGDDDFFIDDASLDVIELAAGGNDTLVSNVSYALASDGIERFFLAGNKNIDATGAGGDEFILGNRGRNDIAGGAGADRLNGRGGNDRLTGDAGADTFIFEPGTGRDRITDYTDGEDRIGLSRLGDIKNFADLEANHMRQTSAGVLIKAGKDEILVEGVLIASLDAGDFVF